MVRIFDALKRAEQERAGGSTPGTITPLQDVPQAQSLRRKLIAVYQSIESGLPEKTSRVITFVGARPGEGTSTLVREFAKLVSTELGQRVVLVDMEHGSGGHHDHFGVNLRAGFEEVVADRQQLEDVLQPVNGDTMFLGCAVTSGASASSVVTDPRFEDLIKRLREKFALVLFDAPPLMNSSDALLLSPKSDGVVMVVEAEKTRWQVAESLREKIIMQGGNILGVILNKRRFHIPQFIYKRL